MVWETRGLGDTGFGSHWVLFMVGTTSENHGIEETSNVLNIQYVNCTSISTRNNL